MAMRRLLDILFMLASAWTMPALAGQQHFAGTWEAKYKDQVFIRLTLQENDGVTGTLSGGNIQANDDGEITEASGGGQELPITNTRREAPDKLTFDWKDSDNETLKFTLRLTRDGEAELRFDSLPEGAKLKPIPLRRH